MIPLLHIVISTAGIYGFLILGFRFFGQRQLGQLTPVDLVIILIMGSAVETAMVNGNTTLSAGLVSAATLLAMNFALSRLFARNKKLDHVLGGGIKLLVHNGHPVVENLRRLGLTVDDLMSAVRERGYDSLDSIKYATFEEDGEITVVEKTAKVLKVPAVKSPDDVKDVEADKQPGSIE
jgi:uncharacterized membrane protein YcaP (DUF421 family)